MTTIGAGRWRRHDRQAFRYTVDHHIEEAADRQPDQERENSSDWLGQRRNFHGLSMRRGCRAPRSTAQYVVTMPGSGGILISRRLARHGAES